MKTRLVLRKLNEPTFDKILRTETENAIDSHPMIHGVVNNRIKFFRPTKSTKEAVMTEPRIAPRGMKLPIQANSSLLTGKP